MKFNDTMVFMDFLFRRNGVFFILQEHISKSIFLISGWNNRSSRNESCPHCREREAKEIPGATDGWIQT